MKQVYRVIRTAAQKQVVTDSEYVAMRLSNGEFPTPWMCVGTGSAEQCEQMVMRSVGDAMAMWTDIPSGAQCTFKS